MSEKRFTLNRSAGVELYNRLSNYMQRNTDYKIDHHGDFSDRYEIRVTFGHWFFGLLREGGMRGKAKISLYKNSPLMGIDFNYTAHMIWEIIDKTILLILAFLFLGSPVPFCSIFLFAWFLIDVPLVILAFKKTTKYHSERLERKIRHLSRIPSYQSQQPRSSQQHQTSLQDSQRTKNYQCLDCGQTLRYIQHFDRWYCDNCEEYK